MFTIRTTKPKNNKYYIRKANGGYSDAIKGNPTDSTANVLANCVGYANGRFAEIIGKKKIQYQLVCNAENFIEKAKAYGLKISNKPTLGGIMVWQKGKSLSGNDGAGHVCIVEKIIDNNTIYTSESGYKSKAFWNSTRTNKNGRWGQASGYTFRGCIVNPAVKEEKTTSSNKESEMATMKGIDISSWQKGLNLSKIKFDFVICKATEGTTIVDNTCDDFIKQAQKLGKPFGFYHFARPELGHTAEAEAEYFYKHTKGYFGKGIPVLDWESSGKSNVAWAKKWLDHIYKLSGVKPLIYMSESVVNSYNWQSVVKADYGLWVAKYRDYNKDYNYDMSNAGSKPNVKWWSFYCMWQWTSSGRLDGYSGNLDCDIFYGDVNTWNKYAGIKKTATTTKEPEKPKEEKKKTTSAIKVGDTVKVINPITYDGIKFKLFFNTYKVMELKGSRAVIGKNGVVTAAINVKNLKKVK